MWAMGSVQLDECSEWSPPRHCHTRLRDPAQGTSLMPSVSKRALLAESTKMLRRKACVGSGEELQVAGNRSSSGTPMRHAAWEDRVHALGPGKLDRAEAFAL